MLGVVAQSVECLIPVQEVVVSILAPDTLLVGLVPVSCDWLRHKSWSPRSGSLWHHIKMSDDSLGAHPWDSQVACTGLPTYTDFRGTYRFWPSITISLFHAVVYRFWKMQEFLGLADFVLFCFCRYSRILPAFCTYRQSRRCVAAINSPPYVINQC